MRKKTIIILIFLSISFYSFLFFESLSHSSLHSINIINESSTNLRSSNTNNETLNPAFKAKSYIGLNGDEKEPTGEGITVAILDSGVDPDHIIFTNNGENDWKQRIFAFYDVDTEGVHDSPYDENGHGTNIASILAGYCSIYHGVAPRMNFIIIKLPESDDGEGFEYTSSEFEDAIDWIIDNKKTFNIKIVSISFGQYISSGRIDTINDLNEKAEELIDKGILVVAGAGNEGKKGQGTIGAPSSAKSVLAVGGVDEEGKVCDFSSRGPSHEGATKPDVSSVAEDVYMAEVSDSDDEFGHQSGTSFATPLVAGLAALLLEVDNELSPQELKNIISLTSFRTFDPQVIKDNNQGWGVVQGYAALDALKEPIKIKQDTEIEISFDEYYNVFCQPIKLESGHYFFELEQKDSAKAEIFLFDSEPDEYGEPILISHSINSFSINNINRRMGVYIPEKHDYYLVVKLVDSTETGAFVIRLIIEYRLTFLLILVALNIVALIYEMRMLLRFKKRNQTLKSVKKKKTALVKIFLSVDAILTLLTISCYILLSNVIVGLFFVIFITSLFICGISLLISLKSLISIRKKNKLNLHPVSDYW